jgi:hypothetical protein
VLQQHVVVSILSDGCLLYSTRGLSHALWHKRLLVPSNLLSRGGHPLVALLWVGSRRQKSAVHGSIFENALNFFLIVGDLIRVSSSFSLFEISNVCWVHVVRLVGDEVN